MIYLAKIVFSKHIVAECKILGLPIKNESLWDCDCSIIHLTKNSSDFSKWIRVNELCIQNDVSFLLRNEKWTLFETFINKVSFGDIDYSKPETLNVLLSFKAIDFKKEPRDLEIIII